MLDHSAGSGRHRLIDRGRDLYSTPPGAVEALLEVEQLPPGMSWEPCAGLGSIVRVLRNVGHGVIASDIAEYGFPLHFVRDFFAVPKMPAGTTSILTNPPYYVCDQFIRHALALSPVVIALLRLNFLESTRRSDILENHRLRRVWVFRNRLTMHRHNWAGPRASSAICFAWFVWTDRYGPTEFGRISHRIET